MTDDATSNSMMNWLRLARISALPSALSNVLLGYLMAHRDWSPGLDVAILLSVSACIYIAGMILNDVFDVAIDSVERPHRPIPAGLISRKSAALAGFGLLLVGVGLSIVAALRTGTVFDIVSWKPLVIGIGLAVLVLLYDGPLKRTIVAPILMGGCRMLNVLLGASTFVAVGGAANPQIQGLGFSTLVWWVAISVGVYITGLTLLARREAAQQQNRSPLAIAAIVIAVGLAGLALIPYVPGIKILANAQLVSMYPLLVGLIALPILRRVVTAVATVKPRNIQIAVITCLKSIIILDAAVCFLIAPDRFIYALIVIALLIPSMLLSRFVPPT